MKNILKVAQSLATRGKVPANSTLRKAVLQGEGIKKATTPAQRRKVDREINRLSNKINEVIQNTTINPNFYEDIEKADKDLKRKAERDRLAQKRAAAPKKEKKPPKEKKETKKREKPFLGTKEDLQEIKDNQEKYFGDLPNYVQNNESLYFGNVQYFQYNSMYEKLKEYFENIEEIVVTEKGQNKDFGRDINGLFNYFDNIYKSIMNIRNKSNKGQISYPIYDFNLIEGSLFVEINW